MKKTYGELIKRLETSYNCRVRDLDGWKYQQNINESEQQHIIGQKAIVDFLRTVLEAERG